MRVRLTGQAVFEFEAEIDLSHPLTDGRPAGKVLKDYDDIYALDSLLSDEDSKLALNLELIELWIRNKIELTYFKEVSVETINPLNPPNNEDN